MLISTSTDDGYPILCEVCGTSSMVNVSRPPGDSVCPACGSFLWVAALVERSREYAFEPDLQIARLDATTREEAVAEICKAMAIANGWTSEQQATFAAAVLEREQHGSTAIGRGLAIPHGKVEWIDRSFSVIAFAPAGIAFDSLDGEQVHTIVMLASPRSRPGDHLRNLEQVSRALRGVG